MMLILSDVEFLKWYHNTSEEIRNRVDQLVCYLIRTTICSPKHGITQNEQEKTI